MTLTQRDTAQETTAPAVRPFRVEVAEADLVDLRRRIAAVRWPERETVTDQSQGVQLQTMQLHLSIARQGVPGQAVHHDPAGHPLHRVDIAADHHQR
jgi:hypothetical protein